MYNQSGKYQAKMQILDPGGKIITQSRDIVTNEITSPIARVTISHRGGIVNHKFMFDASNSEGQNLKYTWYFSDNFHDFDEKHMTSPKTTKKFDSPGKKWGILKVTDRKGQSDFVRFSINVFSDQNYYTRTDYKKFAISG